MLDDLLLGIVEDPLAEPRYLVLADWLEENDDARRAELLRLHRQLLATCCEPDRHPERAGWQARVVELIGQGVRPCVPQRKVMVGKGVEMRFNFIPPGSFLMGSPPQEEGRFDNEVLHRVELTRGFWMGVYPVTQSQWRAVTGTNPSKFPGNDLPVEQVPWDACVGFCERLGNTVDRRFRLPTEAEWEYACRAGTTTAFYFGEAISTGLANYDGNHTYGSGKKGVYRMGISLPTPVGSFPANAWGLFDMQGNVSEWCHDWYGLYLQKDIKDPQGPNNGIARMLRGGSWSNGPRYCRSACRDWNEPGYRVSRCGCRVLLCPDDQGP